MYQRKPKQIKILHTAQSSLYAEKPLHKAAFAHRCLYRLKPLHTDAFTQSSFYRQELSHTGAFYTHNFFDRAAAAYRCFSTQKGFTQRNLYTQQSLPTDTFRQFLHTETFYTLSSSRREKPLHKAAFTHRRLCKRKLLHTNSFARAAFTRRSFYTRKPLNADFSTHKKPSHRQHFMQNSFYTQSHYIQKLLLTGAFYKKHQKAPFEHRHFYIEPYYTQKPLHRAVLTPANSSTGGNFYTQTAVFTHTDANEFTRRCCYTAQLYTQKLLQRANLTHRNLYTQLLLHTQP